MYVLNRPSVGSSILCFHMWTPVSQLHSAHCCKQESCFACSTAAVITRWHACIWLNDASIHVKWASKHAKGNMYTHSGAIS